MISAVKLGPLATSLKNSAAWNDQFPAWPDFADELEVLLAYLDRNGALSRYQPRLRARAQQRDEAINEIRVAFHLDALGYPVVDWSEPQDAPGHNVEYAVALPAGSRGYVEVKSPGWESELTDAERMQGRTKQPKYIGIEGGAAGPVEVIRRAVEKARPKFSRTVPSLVVISDDCFVNLAEWSYGPEQIALTGCTIAYGDGLFRRPQYAVLGAVCLFRVLAYVGQPISYQSLCLANPNALPGAVVPAEMIARLSAKIVSPHA
jgi:hypothetical protein